MAFFRDIGRSFRHFGEEIAHTERKLVGVVKHDIQKLATGFKHQSTALKVIEGVGLGVAAVGAAVLTGGAAIPAEAALLAGGAEAGALGVATAEAGLLGATEAGAVIGAGEAVVGAEAVGAAEGVAVAGAPELSALGRAVKIGTRVGTAVQVAGTAMEVGEMIKVAKEEDKLEDKLTAVGGAIAKLNKIEQLQNKNLTKFGGSLEKIGKGLGKLKGIKVAIEEKGKLEDTQLKRLNNQVAENNGVLEAMKAQGAILPQSLQALDKDIQRVDKDIQSLGKEDIEIEGAVRMLTTRIDRPLSPADLVNDINNFDRGNDIMNYIAENFELINTLPKAEQNRILDLALDKGALASL